MDCEQIMNPHVRDTVQVVNRKTLYIESRKRERSAVELLLTVTEHSSQALCWDQVLQGHNPCPGLLPSSSLNDGALLL
jgi:hypothetical protein